MYFFSNALGGMIAYYPLDDTWTGDSYSMGPNYPEVANLVGPNAVAKRHMAINTTNAMFGNCAYNPTPADAYAGCVASSACRLPLKGDFTVSGWGYVITANLYNTMVSQYVSGNSGRMGLFLSSTNYSSRAAFQMGSTFIQGGASLNDSQWHHIVATKEAVVEGSEYPRLILYVDGIEVARRDSTAFSDVVNTDFLIMAGPAAATNARLDDISVWDEALSAEEVAYIYDQGKNYGKSLAEALKVWFTPARLEVDEGGTTSFTVVLSTPLTKDVTVFMDPNYVDLGAGYGTPVSVTFTPSDWNIPQTVTVTAADDTIVKGLITDKVLVSIPDPNTDPNYVNALTDDVYITIIDDEKYLVLTNADSVVVNEEGETTDNFTVNLGVMPTDTVTVDVAIDSQLKSRYPTSLTFTPDNYMTPQTVTVRALDDTIIEANPHYGTVTLTVKVGGIVIPVYGEQVRVTVYENDCGAWGYLLGDLNKDCIVDLEDFAEIAQDWLLCTLPADVTCVDAR
jgi:hypothetical protein